MQITEVRIKLMDAAADRLRAFCSITIDDAFVVRDLKIIDGAHGPFVAMPSRKLTGHCGNCGSKNHLRANFCNQCGARQNPNRASRDEEGRARLYADIAHPINSECREMIQAKVIEMYEKELELAKDPEYVSRYDEFDDDFDAMDEGVSSGEQEPKSQQESHKADLEAPAAIQTTEEQAAKESPVGAIPPPPEQTDEERKPAPKHRSAAPPQPTKETPPAKPSGSTTPHSKDVEERKKSQTPWHNRPDDEFGAGIF